jgi:hypothetical protein
VPLIHVTCPFRYFVSMAEIDVQAVSDERFGVTIVENGSKSVHEVTATQKHVELLCGDCDPAHLVEASIRFLLDRESKESIMNQFDLDVIASYFPDYPTAIHDYL